VPVPLGIVKSFLAVVFTVPPPASSAKALVEAGVIAGKGPSALVLVAAKSKSVVILLTPPRRLAPLYHSAILPPHGRPRHWMAMLTFVFPSVSCCLCKIPAAAVLVPSAVPSRLRRQFARWKVPEVPD